jgi:Uma2 family endonuclease
MALARKLATYDDLLAYPEGTRTEILAGEIHVQPSPTLKHQLTAGELMTELSSPFQRGRGGPGGWRIVENIDIRFTPHDVVCPDVSAWRQARLPLSAARLIEVVPDWICEVLSPSNFRHDRGYKADLYASHGVANYWLIDPVARQLEAFTLESGRWLRLGAYDETMNIRVPPFDAVEIPLSVLFPQDPPDPSQP